jgi:hypothetical protein
VLDSIVVASFILTTENGLEGNEKNAFQEKNNQNERKEGWGIF